MNEQFKPVWLEALTSGRYQQTTNKLRSKVGEIEVQGGTKSIKGYCCLGVASDLCAKNKELVSGLVVEWSGDDIMVNPGMDENEYQSNEVELPSLLAEAIGIDAIGTLPFKARSRFYKGGDMQDPTYYSLAKANDDGCTFDQIADLIKYFL